MDIHKEFGRPMFEAGAHVRSCLTTAAPSMLDELIVFCGRIVGEPGDCHEELAEIMTALQLDALAARWELDDQLARLLDGDV